MTPTKPEIFTKLKALLPPRWFGENTPVLDSILIALATVWEPIFSIVSFVRLQTRTRTAEGDWLDFAGEDYLGPRIQRRRGETDPSFRQRILWELVRDRCTRAALTDTLLNLSGKAPDIFEPASPRDTGCYNVLQSTGSATAGYGVAGKWGSLMLPYQVFVKIRTPAASGVAMINGWCGYRGGYGAGYSAYVDKAKVISSISQSDINGIIMGNLPAACTAWVSVEP